MSLDLQVGHFYTNKLNETYVITGNIKRGYAGYDLGFRFHAVKLFNRVPLIEYVTESGYFDVANLDKQDRDLVQEVIFQ